METLTEVLANYLIARADKAHAQDGLGTVDHRQYITMVTFGLENQVLSTRRNGNPSNGGWVQKRRTGEVPVSPVLRDLLDAFPLWEWKRATGRYPDDAKWDANAARWRMLTERHGCAPTAAICRESYDWGREQSKNGRTRVGARRAAILDDLPYFEWETTHGRLDNKPRAPYSPCAAAQPGGTRWRPAEMAPRRGVALPSNVEPTSASHPPAERTAVPSDSGFAVDPHQWCRTHIAELMLRDENYTLEQIAGFAGVSTVAVHHWVKDATGMLLKDWRTSNGWPSPTLSPWRAARIVALRSEFPGEPVKAFARRLGISERVARLALSTTSHEGLDIMDASLVD